MISEIKIPKENNFILLRYICAIIVIYEHACVLTGADSYSLGLRDIAVKVFFILSGFWVTRSFLLTNTLFEFYKKRIRKIFPAYIFVVVSSAIFLFFLSNLNAVEYFTNAGFWKYLVANITTLNFIHPNLPGVFNGEPINGSLWTIKIELGFYIILPGLIFLCFGAHEKNSITKQRRCFFVLIIIYLLSLLYTILCNPIIKKYNLPSSIANQLPAFMMYFVTGMLCLLYYEKLFPILNYLIFFSAPMLIILILLRNFVLSAVFEAVTLGIIVMWFALKTKPVFINCKDYSYILYLIHYPIIMVFKEVLC